MQEQKKETISNKQIIQRAFSGTTRGYITNVNR